VASVLKSREADHALSGVMQVLKRRMSLKAL
jgi:hypothetical protein